MMASAIQERQRFYGWGYLPCAPGGELGALRAGLFSRRFFGAAF